MTNPRDRRDELLARVAFLQDELDKVSRELTSLPDRGERRSRNPQSEVAPRRGRPVRAVVLDSLDDIGWPTYSKELGPYASARYGRKIPPTRFGALLADERASFTHGRARSVWLCSALTERGEAIKRLWTRSDWPLEQRIIAPTSGRVQYLKLTSRLCELSEREDLGAADHDLLKFLAADHARDLPGTTVRRGTFDLTGWRAVAEAELARVLSRDTELRTEAARRLGNLAPAHQLFGIPDVIEGSESGRLREAEA